MHNARSARLQLLPPPPPRHHWDSGPGGRGVFYLKLDIILVRKKNHVSRIEFSGSGDVRVYMVSPLGGKIMQNWKEKKKGSMFLSVQVFKFLKEHDRKNKGKNMQKCVIKGGYAHFNMHIFHF